MTNLYRAKTPQAEAAFAPDVFERDFTATEEKDWLDSGQIQIVPRPYNVLSDSFTIEGWPCPQNAVITAGFPIEIEAALISGGHIQRVVDEPAPKPAAKPAAKTDKE
jgi:hypothetical protein